MKITRRAFVLTSMVASAAEMFGQGEASRAAQPQARPRPSGRPFDAHFVDVANAAGLTLPVIYGDAHAGRKRQRSPTSVNRLADQENSRCTSSRADFKDWETHEHQRDCRSQERNQR